jgi:hypothetical protein
MSHAAFYCQMEKKKTKDTAGDNTTMYVLCTAGGTGGRRKVSSWENFKGIARNRTISDRGRDSRDLIAAVFHEIVTFCCDRTLCDILLRSIILQSMIVTYMRRAYDRNHGLQTPIADQICTIIDLGADSRDLIAGIHTYL